MCIVRSNASPGSTSSGGSRGKNTLRRLTRRFASGEFVSVTESDVRLEPAADPVQHARAGHSEFRARVERLPARLPQVDCRDRRWIGEQLCAGKVRRIPRAARPLARDRKNPGPRGAGTRNPPARTVQALRRARRRAATARGTILPSGLRNRSRASAKYSKIRIEAELPDLIGHDDVGAFRQRDVRGMSGKVSDAGVEAILARASARATSIMPPSSMP